MRYMMSVAANPGPVHCQSINWTALAALLPSRRKKMLAVFKSPWTNVVFQALSPLIMRPLPQPPVGFPGASRCATSGATASKRRPSSRPWSAEPKCRLPRKPPSSSPSNAAAKVDMMSGRGSSSPAGRLPSIMCVPASQRPPDLARPDAEEDDDGQKAAWKRPSQPSNGVTSSRGTTACCSKSAESDSVNNVNCTGLPAFQDATTASDEKPGGGIAPPPPASSASASTMKTFGAGQPQLANWSVHPAWNRHSFTKLRKSRSPLANAAGVAAAAGGGGAIRFKKQSASEPSANTHCASHTVAPLKPICRSACGENEATPWRRRSSATGAMSRKRLQGLSQNGYGP
mmetsp:Transcript_115684/g.327118  ORF Transcript_115684/g.327118 Transcript_115684/m.327118 type:complete len:344 (+) Transcript_115684:503-1534(+)